MLSLHTPVRFNDISISRKLATSTLLMIIMLVIVGTLGIYGMNTIQNNMNSIIVQQNAKTTAIQAMRLDYAIGASILDQAVLTNNVDLQKQMFAALQDNVNTLVADMHTYLALPHLPGERADAAAIQQLIPAFVEQNQPLLDLAQKNVTQVVTILRAAFANPSGQANTVLLTPHFDSLLTFLARYIQTVRAETNATSQHLLWLMVAAILVGAGASFLIGYVITRIIVTPLDATVRVVQQVATGDLRPLHDFAQRHGGKDATGQLAYAVESMVANLRGLITQIYAVSDVITADSQQIQIAAEQTTEATEDVAKTIEGVSLNAGKEARELARVEQNIEQLRHFIDDSQYNAQENTQFMQSLNQSFDEMVENIRHLGTRSETIGHIIQTIAEIAGQTNLLALNAAIEAARAGEQGRGFAVVADEVRKLAERSAQASHEISDIIHEIQETTSRTVVIVENGVGVMAQGVQRSSEIHQQSAMMTKSSTEITTAVADITVMGQETSNSTEAASAAIEEITSQMLEASSTTKNLVVVVEDLQQQIQQFRLGDDAHAKQSPLHVIPVLSARRAA